jgi:hypothetical protein
MLKRFALLLAATTTLAIPTTGAFAAPGTNADGVLPEEACLAAYPAHTQPLLCGRGPAGPSSADTWPGSREREFLVRAGLGGLGIRFGAVRNGVAVVTR